MDETSSQHERPTSPAAIPLCFLGLGVYRAWIEIAFVGTFVSFPTHQYASHDAFDIFMVATLLLCAAFARRLSPLHTRRWARRTCAALLVSSTALEYVSIWHPGIAAWAAWPCALAGGVGIALMILLWSELYGTLSPVRICLYYAASLVTGALIIWVYLGFKDTWLPVMTCLLPLVALAMLRTCYRVIPKSAQPSGAWARFSFPWKPVLVIAAYSFAFGLQEASAYQSGGPHSSPGLVACCLLVIAGIALAGKRVEFAHIYSSWLPFMSALFLILPLVGLNSLDVRIGAQCANAGYAATEIFIMTMIGSISYHHGVSAVWLFGIERGVRALAMVAGRLLEANVLADNSVALAVVAVVTVLVATFVIAGEKRLSSDWGVQLRRELDAAPEDNSVARRNALTKRCAELSARNRLSQREEEVLLLLAEHKTISEIERELYIANGTAKAHIRHIYQKLDIHSREELFSLVGVDANTDG